MSDNKMPKWVAWKDEFGRHRAKVVEFNGELGMEVRWTDSCSGCHETVDGQSMGCYPYDAKAKCEVGAGCEDCGYTGKSRRCEWVPLPPEALERLATEDRNG